MSGPPRTALVTGVTGQIGWFVARQLAHEGLKVYGLVRQTTVARMNRDEGLFYSPISGDLLDEYSLTSILERIRPDEIYNFAGQTFIPASWEQPILTAQYTGLALVRFLETARRVVPETRFVQAGSSELFAGCGVSPQDERTAIVPTNPYGVAKAFAFHTVSAYRARYGLFASNAIFYTNESPRRSPEFLFRKVTRGVAEIAARGFGELRLGNLDVVRDWGYAPDFADAAIKIARHSVPDDFVIATGEGHTVRELVERAFSLVGLDYRDHVVTDPAYHRPAEPAPLVGRVAKAKDELGWKARQGLDGLVRIMLAHDLAALGRPLPFELPPGVRGD